MLCMKKLSIIWIFFLFLFACKQKQDNSIQPTVSEAESGSVLPFPEHPSASTYGESILENKHVRRTYPSHLPANSPNILIVLMDDVGFGSFSAFGGEINTPDLSNVDGKQVATGEVKRTVPAAFTASETFDVGTDLGSPVSLRYHKKAPFKFNGKIKTVKVDLL
jgi:hypothetical protein